MEAQCSAILKDTAKVTTVIDEATRIQDRVYSAYNKVRHEAATKVPTSTKPQDLIKNLARK
jgi:hypothetical protein